MRAAIVCYFDELEAAASLTAQTSACCAAPELWVLGGLRGFPAGNTGAADVFEVIFSREEILDEPLCCAAALSELFGGEAPELMVTVSGLRGDELAAQLSIALNLGCILGASALSPSKEGLTVSKDVYAGNLGADFSLSGTAYAVSLLPDGSKPQQTTPVVHTLASDASSPPWLTESVFSPDESGRSLSDAELIIAAGRGAGRRDNIAKLDALAQKLGGVLGGSRPVICDGKLPADRLLGMSGVRAAPRVCIVFGASGAGAFRAGVEGSRLLIAVNTDPDAPIFGFCNYGVIADSAKFAEALISALDSI